MQCSDGCTSLISQDRNSDGPDDGDHTGFGEDDLFYPRKTDRASSYDQGGAITE